MLNTRNGLGLDMDCVASWPHCSVGKHWFVFRF